MSRAASDGGAGLPTGDAEGLRGVATALERAAHRALGTAGVTGTAAGQLAKGWQGQAADQAGVDLGTLAKRARDTVPHLSVGARGLRAYADALDHATGLLRAAGKRRDEVLDQHARDVAVAGFSAADPLLMQRLVNEADRQRDAALATVSRREEAVRAELQAAGTRLARLLGQSVAQAFPTATAGDPSGVRASVLRGLPTVASALTTTAAARAAAQLILTADDVDKADAVMAIAEQYGALARDPAFAAALLELLGPEGLVRSAYVTRGAVADGQRSGDRDQAARATAAERFLSQVLAHATDREAQAHVSDAWLARLATEAKREGGFGYVVLGQLLRDGYYSAGFLDRLGRDLIAFERTELGASSGGQGWPTTSRRSLDAYGVLGTRDPVNGLMLALSRNVDASKLLLDPMRPDQAGQAQSILEYLVADRQWTPDLHGHRDGLVALGAAIRGAALDEPRDLVSAAIMAGTVKFLAEGGAVRDARRDVVPAELRVPVAEALAGYMADVDQAYSSDALTGQLAGRVTGQSRPVAVFAGPDLRELLPQLAAHPDGYAALVTGQLIFEQQVLSDIANDPQRVAARMDKFADVSAKLSSARAEAVMADYARLDKAYNDSLQLKVELAKGGADLIAGQVKAPFASGLLASAIDSYAQAYVDEASQDSSRLAADLAHRLKEADAAALRGLAEAAVWEQMAHPDMVRKKYKELFELGQPRPYYEIQTNDDLLETWRAYQRSAEYELAFLPIHGAVHAHDD